jgi:hypothetical protein
MRRSLTACWFSAPPAPAAAGSQSQVRVRVSVGLFVVVEGRGGGGCASVEPTALGQVLFAAQLLSEPKRSAVAKRGRGTRKRYCLVAVIIIASARRTQEAVPHRMPLKTRVLDARWQVARLVCPTWCEFVGSGPHESGPVLGVVAPGWRRVPSDTPFFETGAADSDLPDVHESTLAGPARLHTGRDEPHDDVDEVKPVVRRVPRGVEQPVCARKPVANVHRRGGPIDLRKPAPVPQKNKNRASKESDTGSSIFKG